MDLSPTQLEKYFSNSVRFLAVALALGALNLGCSSGKSSKGKSEPAQEPGGGVVPGGIASGGGGAPGSSTAFVRISQPNADIEAAIGDTIQVTYSSSDPVTLYIKQNDATGCSTLPTSQGWTALATDLAHGTDRTYKWIPQNAFDGYLCAETNGSGAYAVSKGRIKIKPSFDIVITNPGSTAVEIEAGTIFNGTFISNGGVGKTADFYFSENSNGCSTGLNGWTKIPGGSVTATGGKFSWNTAGVPPGHYYICGTIKSGVQEAFGISKNKLTIEAGTPSLNPPTLSLSEPADLSQRAGTPITIGVTAADPDSDAQFSLYYSKSADHCELGLDGWTTISQNNAKTVNSVVWNTAGLEGEYYICGVISDGTNTVYALSSWTMELTAGVFITKWDTRNVGVGPKAADNLTIKLPIIDWGGNDFVVDWGDGQTNTIDPSSPSPCTESSEEHCVDPVNSPYIHQYAEAGEYTITIVGKTDGFTLSLHPTEAGKLTSVEQWGNIAIFKFGSAFRDASNLEINATDIPNLAGVESLYALFEGARNITTIPGIEHWNVSTIRDISYMFKNVPNFNQNISKWNTSSVTTMAGMFDGASSFNQPIGVWDTSNVTRMHEMFRGAAAFNQPLAAWNTASVTEMHEMFHDAAAFNQNISNWNTASVTNMREMFRGATAFNQPLDDWNTENVTNFYAMFRDATSFNQPLNTWKTAKVIDMSFLFAGATSFNRNLDLWNTSAVTDMNNMFNGAVAFNQNLSAWNVSSVGAFQDFLTGVKLSTNYYDALLVEWSKQSLQSNVGFNGGLSTYSALAETARTSLNDDFGWNILDGGLAP